MALLAGGVLLAGMLVVTAVAWGGWILLRAAPGEWSHPVQWGPWRFDASVPTLLRIATHPVVLRRLEGRTLATRFGPVQWQSGEDPQHWQIACAPCRIHLPELGDDAVALARVTIDAHRLAQDRWRGELALGDDRRVKARWKASFDARGATLEMTLPPTPLDSAYRLFEHELPELRRARIEGTLRLDARLSLPQRQLSVTPHIEGFVVDGLGTDSLLHAEPACGPLPAHGFGTWLPRAVIAAEDQRFHEHPGYDMREITAAWMLNHRERGTARGGSTLSQQLAKLLYTGSERHHLRKLRELLYAVELDRTLGKARVLELYLAMAPWGDGQCGAAAAARHHLHKRVDRLTPTEAAWLASLLHSPDREWARYQASGQVNEERVGWVIAHMRPMRAEKRQALVEALPGWSPR
ncbi:biosynthetic peptidoglycan transglycosylase [Piscinibacter sp. XHJ-5]|uniref:biosynthetic peptidoglycan transglycosylase n=1 Tax=Piscinibacter sp. XHJ-5 TaxID=3037797 RepID=UPI0024528BF8|nr:biosynthetic peptidoglycan transglycosylase [Piscinibacter sp. XHJ-5]